MAAFKKIAIVGAAGNLGRCILQELVDAHYDVTVISRAESTSVFPGVPEQNIIRGEYTVEFFRKALLGQDALVLAIGSSALDTQKEIIDVAVEVGVKRIIPSEFGSDISNPASLKAIPFNQGKKVVADHLEKVVATSPQTTWTGVTSGPFFDWCLEWNLFGCDVKTHQATLYDEGKTRFDATNIDTVGKVVAKILSMPEKFQNERILISGMAVTQLEILEAFKKATEPKDWVVSYRTSESLRQEGNDKVAKHDYSGILDIIGASLFQDGNGSHHSVNGNVMNEVLGVKDDLSRSVEKYINTYRAKE